MSDRGKRAPKKTESGKRAMSEGGSSGDVFDVRKVRRLVELMNEHDLAEVDLKQGDQRIRLRRGQEPVLSAPTLPLAAAQASPAPAAVPAMPATPVEAADDEANAVYVTSPMVGTFYVSPSPEAPPFVSVGDSVGPDTVVCIIEAMKVFNEIPAECSGKILSRMVENGAAVEYGQKLYRVQRG